MHKMIAILLAPGHTRYLSVDPSEPINYRDRTTPPDIYGFLAEPHSVNEIADHFDMVLNTAYKQTMRLLKEGLIEPFEKVKGHPHKYQRKPQ